MAHALALLAALRDHPSLAVRESAALLGVAPSTAHRLLTTLHDAGFVAQDPRTRRYLPGPELLALAMASLHRIDVARVARPHLSALAAASRETVSLGVAEGATVRFLDSVEGPEVVRVSSRTGEVVPAHLAAAGKVLLAAMDPEEVLRLYPGERLVRHTARSLSSRSGLLAELASIRTRGYATSYEESAPGLAAVAAPIRDPQGRAIASLSISLPAERLDPQRVDPLAELVCRRAARIQAELGPPTPAPGPPAP